MPVFVLQLPDGRKARIQAPDQASAIKAAQGIPARTGEKADYQRELTKARARGETRKMYTGGGALSAFSDAMSQPLPVADEIGGLLAGAGNEVVNLGRRATGRPTVSSRAIYEANRDAIMEEDAANRRDYPKASGAGGLLAGFSAAPARGAAVVKAAPVAASRVKAVTQAAGIGAGQGAAYGVGEGRTARDRARNAVVGATVGGLTGGTLETAAPVVEKVGRKAVGAVLKATKKGPAAEDLGTRTAVEILARKGLTSENIAERAAPYAGMGITAAELGGKDTTRKLASLARQGGETGDLIDAAVRARAAPRPERMLTGISQDIGLNPRAARGEMESLVETGQALADPAYDAMRANPAGIIDDELSALMQHPIVQRAMQAEERIGRISDSRGVGLAYGDVAVPSRPVGPADLGVGGGEVPVPRGPAQPPSQGPSALTALRQSGEGITADLAGEAQQQGLRLGARQGGAELNDMAIRLHEQGFTPRVLSEDEMAQLLGSGEAQRLFARAPDPAAQQRFEARRAAEELNAQGGLPGDVPTPEQYEGSFATPERPMTEPARMHAPTEESWDRILRRIDKQVERDPLTGRALSGKTSDDNDEIVAVAGRLRELLTGGEAPRAPNMAEGRAIASDYKGLQGVYNRTKGLLSNATEGDFTKAWRSLKTPAEKDAFKGAVANDLYEMWGRGGLTVKGLEKPAMRVKLELAFGKDEATRMIERVGREAQLAASGSRLNPDGGSATFGLGEAARETQQKFDSAVDWAKIAGATVSGHPYLAAGAMMRKLRKGMDALGPSEEVRDAMGKILIMSPDELTPLLREFETLPPEVQKVVRQRAEKLGLIGGRVGVQAASEGEDY